MGRCIRCGREDHVEYGSDGQSYCSACIFYGLNKQCGKCRMYLPSSELQQYKGMWLCPYCIQDMRDEDRKSAEYKPGEYKPAKEPLKVISYTEACERCGREVETLYSWNGRNLCARCLHDEQGKWTLVGGGPSGAPQRVIVVPAKKKPSFFESLISELRAVLGMKKRKAEIVPASKMPIQYARPMVEKGSGKAGREIQLEGIMKKKKAPGKKTGKKPGEKKNE